jgi:hypothetical protein
MRKGDYFVYSLHRTKQIVRWLKDEARQFGKRHELYQFYYYKNVDIDKAKEILKDIVKHLINQFVVYGNSGCGYVLQKNKEKYGIDEVINALINGFQALAI